MLKLNVGLSRKVGEPNYGSRGASVNVEMELESALASDAAKLQERIRQLFDVVRASLLEELRGTQPCGCQRGKQPSQRQRPPRRPGKSARQRPSQRQRATNGNGHANTNGQATEKGQLPRPATRPTGHAESSQGHLRHRAQPKARRQSVPARVLSPRAPGGPLPHAGQRRHRRSQTEGVVMLDVVRLRTLDPRRAEITLLTRQSRPIRHAPCGIFSATS